MKMPFGKYKGEEVEDLDTSYIVWCLENASMSTVLTREMESQLALREGKGVVRNKGIRG